MFGLVRGPPTFPVFPGIASVGQLSHKPTLQSREFLLLDLITQRGIIRGAASTRSNETFPVFPGIA